MFLSICYVFVFIVSIILITLIKKSKNQVNAIGAIFSSFVMLLSFDAICALIMTVFKIPVYLLSVMICNIALSTVIIYVIKKKTGFEKLFLSYVDLFFSSLIFIIVFSIANHIFNGFTIGYNSGDSPNHFLFAMWTLREKSVKAMFFDPLYNALFIETCLPFIKESHSFILITISDTFMLFCEAEFIYLVLSMNNKGCKKKCTSFLLTILCLFGYPMYSFTVGGFLYLTCALMLSCFIIYWLKQYFANSFSKPVCLTFISTGCISLVFTYTLLSPLVIGSVILSIGIYELSNVEEELRCKALIIMCSIILVCALLMTVAVTLYLKGDGQRLGVKSAISFFTQALKSDGYMYSRIYSDLLILFPAIIFVMMGAYKEKNLFGLFTLSYVFCVILCYFLCTNGYISGYYYYKSYYILWIVGWICIGEWINNLSIIFHVKIAYFITILFICLTSFLSTENSIYINCSSLASHHEGFCEEAKIYYKVHDSISKSYDSWWLNDDYMELLEYSMDEKKVNCAIVIEQDSSNIENTQRIRIYEAITGNFSKDMTEFDYDTFVEVIKNWNFSLLALYKESPFVKEHSDWFKDLDVVFENSTFTVVSTEGLN